jgi:glycosyltransferase involved in cell wall biosynthesis
MSFGNPIGVLFHSRYNHAKMGGQKSLLTLIDHLDRKRIKPYLIIPKDGELRLLAEKKGVEVCIKSIPSYKPINFFKLKKTRNEIVSFVKERNIKLIHSDNVRFSYFSTFVAKKARIKSIYHARVNGWRKYDKQMESRIDKIIGISESPKNRFPVLGNSEKYKVIYNGTDCNTFTDDYNQMDVRKELGVSQYKKVVLFVGKLRESKGLDDSLEALKLIENGDDIAYYVIGSEEQKGNKEKYLEMSQNLECSVHFIGQKDNVYKWMQAADIVLFPSHNEGMGRVPFEAMATGTPVIACDIPGVNEAVTNEVGILVKVKSPQQLANAIIKLLNDDELYNKLARNGRKRALELFDIKVHAKNMMELFEEMVNENEN